MTDHPILASPTTTACVAGPGWRVWHLAALAALTAYSTGLAWQAQFVSYPLYSVLDTEEFAAYHLAYNAAIPGVVIIPGFLGFLACVTFPFTKPAGITRLAAGLVAASGIGSILSTVLWAIPMHDRLDRVGQDAATITSLLQANGVRTAWLTMGTIVLSWSLVRLIGRGRQGRSRVLDAISAAASAAPRRVGSPHR